MSSSSPFPHPWWGWFLHGNFPPRCFDEWLIIMVSNGIRRKPGWRTKCNDETILAKWRQEIKQQFQTTKARYLDVLVDYLLRELQWYDQQELALNNKYTIGCFDGILYGNDVVSLDVKTKLQRDIARLTLLVEQIDYHPNSNNQVIDLVHPSLYPFRYGKSPIVVDGRVSLMEHTKEISEVKDNVTFGQSEHYQWLPALMEKQNNRFVFASYINNLHPLQHRALYETIQDVFNAAIPGINFCLSISASETYVRVPVPKYEEVYNQAYHDKLAYIKELDDWDEVAYQELVAMRNSTLVDYSPVYKGGPVIDKPINVLDFENLKVIVKLANIELTPENPSYPGGSWHVEGTINEDIVATVLYYYDVENITESRLSFKYTFDDPYYEQDDKFYCTDIFDLEDDRVMSREVGHVEAQEGRVVIFPNTLQHHVDAFKLKDKTKSGHRKILCFFITDPYNNKVVTTAQVPPQQPDWWQDQTLIDQIIPDKKIQRKILELDSSWRITFEQAKKEQEKLMDERRPPPAPSYEDDPDEYPYRRRFSLCEH